MAAVIGPSALDLTRSDGDPLEPATTRQYLQVNRSVTDWSSRPMDVTPFYDRIMVRRLDEGERRSGGIIIPDTAKEKT